MLQVDAQPQLLGLKLKTIVTKKHYAALKNRSISAVSHWISTGKISQEALQGEGVRARIWVERADQDLERGLDPAKQAAQAIPVQAGAPNLQPSPQSRGSPDEDDDIRRRRKADADRAEHEAEAARRRLAIDEGRWIDAAEAAKAWTREYANALAEFENFLTAKASRALGEHHSLDWKPLSIELRDLFRQHRMTAAESAKEKREKLEQAPPEMAEAAE